jgi:hypothetical protein
LIAVTGPPTLAIRATAGLGDDGHLMRIGVHHDHAIGHDADMSLPEHQVAAPRPSKSLATEINE